MDRYSWLPNHQQHVVYSLAHADELIARTGQIVLGYTKHGTLNLTNVVVGANERVTVAGVVPLPQAVPRFAADALNQLRSTLEHVVYAEIVHQAPGSLGDQEARKIEMPAATTSDDFEKWARQGARHQLAPLQSGATLHQRIRDLQPFHRHDVHEHPLRVLVEHTNWSKHRTPSVAATLLGTVVPDDPAEDILLPAVPDRPIGVGDVLASVPAKRRVGFSIYPQVSIQRPHTESWHNLLHELRDLEQWVRELAIPILITGTSDVPVLPPHLDTTMGYADLRAALAAADPTPAAARMENDLQAGIARESLPTIIMLHPEARQHATAISRWIAELGADQVRQKFDSLCAADPQQLMATVRAMIVDARTASGKR